MKIYEFQLDNGKEWVCAYDFLEAIKTHTSMTDCHIDDYNKITEVFPGRWSKMFIYDPDTKEKEMSFKQYMKTATEPDIIATTVY